MLSVRDLLKEVHPVTLSKNKELMELITGEQDLFDELLEIMLEGEKKICRGASYIVRRALDVNPKLILKHKKNILKAALAEPSDEIKWCIALMFKHFKLTGTEKHKVFIKLLKWSKEPIGSGSQAACMNGLADVSGTDKKLKPLLLGELNSAFMSTKPAIKARAKYLLKEINRK